MELLKMFSFVFILFVVTLVSAASTSQNVYLNGVGDGEGVASLRALSSRGITKIQIKIQVKDLMMERGRIFEGWLVDVDSGYKLSLGSFNTRRNNRGVLNFRQTLVNPLIYDKVVVTKEPLYDIDPNPGEVVLEGDIEDSIGTVVNLQAFLKGRNEIPRINSRGNGFGEFVLDSVENTVSFDLGYSNLMGIETVSHIHGFASTTENSGVLFTLPFGDEKVGVWNYNSTPEIEADIISGLTYVNVHTDKYPNGEIRGQVMFLL